MSFDWQGRVADTLTRRTDAGYEIDWPLTEPNVALITRELYLYLAKRTADADGVALVVHDSPSGRFVIPDP